MTAYQTVEQKSPIGIRQIARREVKMGRNGALLACGEARYDTLDEYVAQMGAPVSQLRGAGLWSFADPCMPEIVILVQTKQEEYCRKCDEPLDVCECPF